MNDGEARYNLWRDALASEMRRVDATMDGGHGYAPIIPFRLGGPDPLDYVATFRRDAPAPHWLFVTIGFSAPLDDDPLPNLARPPSGYGFELTLRIPREPNDSQTEAPISYAVFLQSIARYVFRSGNALRDGDYLDFQGPIGDGSTLEALGIAPDAELLPIVTPFGRIGFSSVVGLTRDELVAVQSWNTTAFVDLAVARGKLDAVRTTDPARTTFLDDRVFGAEVRAGGARDGSKTERLYVERFTVRERKRPLRASVAELVFGPAAARMLARVLPNRISFGCDLTLFGTGITLTCTPGTATRYERRDTGATLTLDGGEAKRIASEIDHGATTIVVARNPPVTILIE